MSLDEIIICFPLTNLCFYNEFLDQKLNDNLLSKQLNSATLFVAIIFDPSIMICRIDNFMNFSKLDFYLCKYSK